MKLLMHHHQPSARPVTWLHGLAALAGALACTAGGLAAGPAAQAAVGNPVSAASHPRCEGSGYLDSAVVDHSTGTNDELNGLSTVSATDAWAVGTRFVEATQTSATESSFFLHWNGTQWSKVASPNPGGTSGSTVLNSVCADSATDAWAVGNYSTTPGSVPKSLIVHWNGKTWTQVASPNPSGGGDYVLNSVSALSATDAWAVGYYNTIGYAGPPLILHWDGKSWVRVPSPGPGTSGGLAPLDEVSADSVADASAVGYYYTNTGNEETFALHWNGTSWKRVPSPSSNAANTGLIGVSAVSATDAWSVGLSTPDNVHGQSLIVRWNGTGWTKVASPNPGGTSGYTVLSGVNTNSATDAWAVGYYDTNGGSQQPSVALRWNGKSWTRVASPEPGGKGQTLLQGVCAVSATDAWAVGSYNTNPGTSDSQPLIVHWNGKSWTQVPTPS